MELQQLSQILGAEPPTTNVSFDAISIDTRTIQPGECYCALRGERLDGHDYVADAQARGAVAAIVEHPLTLSIPQLVVNDSLQALTDYARYHRQQFSPLVLALTGSNGKTTVKEMLAAIFSSLGPTFATQGNFNNHIGVPLSVLKLTSEHQTAIFELGASAKGEIAHTADLVQPSITLINNVSAAHIEGFGSVSGVAQAKGEIYQALPSDGTAVINLDDDFADFWLSTLNTSRVITFSMHDETATITAHSIILNNKQPTRFTLVTPHEQQTIQLSLPGKHNVNNALAAAAMAYAAGCTIEQIATGLSQVKQVAGRMVRRKAKQGGFVYDDTYNASPNSVKAAIDTLTTHTGKRILVLGDMAELGTQADEYHREVGRYAKKSGIDALYSVGELTSYACESFGEKAKHFQTQQELIHDISPIIGDGVTCVVKGSRSTHMERVVEAICEKN